MQAVANYWRELTEEAGSGWNRFWFTPASPRPLGILRIAAGLIAVAYFLSWTNSLVPLLSANGLLPPETVGQLLGEQRRDLYRFSPLFALDSPAELYAYHAVAVVAALLFAAGVFTRISSIITLVIFLTYVHRAPLLTGPLETVLVLLLFYLAIGPSGAAYSFDAWRLGAEKSHSDESSWLANLSLRLMQVHLTGFILLVALSMLASPVWWDGTAMWTIAAQELSSPIDLSWLQTMPKLVNGWTHLFVLVNLLFPVLVWNRLLRPLVIAVTALFWLLMIPLSGQVLYVVAVLTAMYAFSRSGSPNRT